MDATLGEPYAGVWTLVYSTVRAFWALVEPRIHAAAAEQNVPMELYYYAELGLEIFSIPNFQKRDPYSNPAQYPPVFEKLVQGGWIAPQAANEYRVSEQARSAVRNIVRAGDDYLETLEVLSANDLTRLNELLQRIVHANRAANEPPPKWASINRFRVADENSSLLSQIREALMDLFAFRDDSYRAAWHAFPADGLMWNTFSMLWDNTADTPADMAQQAAFRGYDAAAYAQACEKLIPLGWVLRGTRPDTFELTPIGKKLRGAVEDLTDAYFYFTWSNLIQEELDELLVRLRQLRTRLESGVLNH